MTTGAEQGGVRMSWGSARHEAPADLGARLLACARGSPALRRALARVAGRLAATRGWERLGFARLGDYAVERAGVSARELRDLVAVDTALGALLGLERAFLEGRIGWTSLRLVCRAAKPEDQDRWLALADALTARELAREVRAVDRQARRVPTTGSGGDGRREGVVLRIHRRARARWWHALGVASRVAGQRLSHAGFAEVLAAEVLSGVSLEPGDAVEAAPEGSRGAVSPPEGRRIGARVAETPAPGPAPDVEVLLRDLDSADAFELDRRLRRGLALEQRQLARLAALLADAVALRLHRDAGFNSVDAWAEEWLGLSRSRARALLRVERAARACPALGSAFASGRLSWVQAEALLPLLLDPAATAMRESWLAHAGCVSVRRLRDDVERALALGDFALPALEPSSPTGVQTGADTGSRAETARLFFVVDAETAQLFRTLLAVAQRALERARGRPCTRSDALESMLDHALAAWTPEPPTARERREWAVFERDGWRCTAPGCSAQRNLQRHHVVFRSQGGGDQDSNLTTLCAWHHLRGVHASRLRCSGTAPGSLRFELGLRPGAPPLARYASGDVALQGARSQLV